MHGIIVVCRILLSCSICIYTALVSLIFGSASFSILFFKHICGCCGTITCVAYPTSFLWGYIRMLLYLLVGAHL